jgi:uncharacterized phosphosugar-binding protein
MVTAKTYKDEIIKLIDELYESQNDNIEKAAKMMVEAIKNDGVIHVFGSGHSVGLGIDISNRLGSLVPIHIMDTADFVYRGGVSVEEFTDKVNIFERRPNMAGRLYNLYDIRENDVFIVISNSGINGVVIDIAALAKENGHKVCIITSMKHTTVEESRHPSGKKLYMFGDVVIDNCGPHGDALLPTNGPEKVTSVSSICNNVVAQTMAARIIELLKEENIDLPVLTEDEERNQRIRKYYGGRI